MGEALDREDESGDTERRFLDLGGEAANDAAGRGPMERGAQGGTVDHRGEPVEVVECHGGLGERFRDVGIEAVVLQPIRDRVLVFGLLDGGPYALDARRRARVANRIHGGELLGRKTGGPEREGGLFGILDSFLEENSASLDRRGGVVQLVREPGGEFAEGDQFLVVEVARGERSRAVEHRVNEARGELVALASQLAEVIAMNHQNRRRFLREDVARRVDHPGIGKEAEDVALAPFHHFARSATAIREDRDAAIQKDEEPLHGSVFRTEELAGLEVLERAVCDEPLELRARRRAEGPVLREPIEKIGFCHKGMSLHRTGRPGNGKSSSGTSP